MYEGNPKHKKPWQPGRKGSLCPPDISLEHARNLLQLSILKGSKRYAVDKGRALCALQNDRRRDRWHGYPVGWVEVPAGVRQEFRKKGLVSNRELREFWWDIG